MNSGADILQHANTSQAPDRQGPYQSILEADINND